MKALTILILLVTFNLINLTSLYAQVTQEWVKRYNGVAHTNDEAYSIASDASGNVYVAGISYFSYPTLFDKVIIKYNSSGVLQWERKYYASSKFGVPIVIKCDSSGFVYFMSSDSNGCVTIKYNSNGDSLWVRKYIATNGIGKTIAVDNSGNVYVAGSRGSVSNTDFFTIKYNSSGVQQWVQLYNAPENSNDVVNSIATDGSGNVYVTGYSQKPTNKFVYTTIKYNSVGDSLWVRRYNGLGDGDHKAVSVAVNTSGIIYVTGTSALDCATIKYDSNGDSLWVRRYAGPSFSADRATSLILDNSGNIFVAGGSGTATYLTIKYNFNGDSLWVNKYQLFSIGGGVYAIALDNSGNVYVTGTSTFAATVSEYVTVKYDSNGNQQWVRKYNPANVYYNSNIVYSLVVDVSGNVYVAGRSFDTQSGFGSSDYTTIKYNSNGDSLWVRRYDRPNGAIDGGGAMATDNSGNVYVTGGSGGNGVNSDYVTIKYNSNGDSLWVRRYNAPSNGDDIATAIAVDASGNVYVSGESSSNNATIKYNSNGDSLWVRRNGVYSPTSIKVDGSGNVYVLGWSFIGGTEDDYAIIKYNSSGVQQWLKIYNGPVNGDDMATSLAIDGLGNAYVTGWSAGSGSNDDYVTIKYNSIGDSLWVKRYNGPGNSIDRPYSLAIDDSGNVYVTGSTLVTGINSDYATIKYNSSGVQQWVQRYNGPGNSGDGAYSLEVDGLGNVYVTGISRGGIGPNYATIKYNSNGDSLWVKRYNDYLDVANAFKINLALDVLGNVYVASSSSSSPISNSPKDYVTMKYSSTGIQEWVQRYRYYAPGYYTDKISSLAVDGSGNVYISGQSFNGNEEDYATIKYSQQTTSMTLKITALIEGFYNNITDKMVKDTAKIYLRHIASPYNKVDSAKSVLDSTGKGTFSFSNAVNGIQYYLVISHRNSIETWSNTGQMFSSDSLVYSFTTTANKAYGDNLILKGTRFCLFSGDVNQEGIIDLTDIVNISNDASNFVSGYVSSDVNGDNITDLTDLIITYNNSNNFVTKITP